jgi:DNA-directed RNA polymerase specialized sigma24 family protein
VRLVHACVLGTDETVDEVAVTRVQFLEPRPRAHQRKIFVAIVLNGVPMDALITELGSTRNAIYKTMFDARRKLRAALAANRYLNDQTSGHS